MESKMHYPHLNFCVLQVVSVLDWLVILHFGLVLKSASSVSRNFVVSFTSLVCWMTATDSFSSNHPLCRYLAVILILYTADIISVPTRVRKFHPSTNGSTSPGKINGSWSVLCCPFFTSTSSCASISPHLPSANLTFGLVLVNLPSWITPHKLQRHLYMVASRLPDTRKISA